MKQQVLFIHGGNCFDKYEDYLEFLRNKEFSEEYLRGRNRWRDHLQEDLGDDYDVILPQMPCGYNAKYAEWKIWFEKFFPYLEDNIILMGGSLGGMFLAKYLSENYFPKKIKAAFILAAQHDDEGDDNKESMADFTMPGSMEKFEKQTEKVFLYHSKDDPLVPFTDLDKFAAKLPHAEKVIFEDKGHFMLEEFPEIVEKLKSLK